MRLTQALRATAKLPKPQLHGHSVKRGLRNATSAVINAAIGGWSFNYFFINRRKRIYRDFYEQYDIEASFERMRAKGLFDSC